MVVNPVMLTAFKVETPVTFKLLIVAIPVTFNCELVMNGIVAPELPPREVKIRVPTVVTPET